MVTRSSPHQSATYSGNASAAQHHAIRKDGQGPDQSQLTSSANTAGLDLEQNIVVAELGQRNLDDGELARLRVPLLR